MSSTTPYARLRHEVAIRGTTFGSALYARRIVEHSRTNPAHL